MAKIKIGSKICKLFEDNLDIIHKIDEELSFDVQGAQYTKAFQGYFDKDGHFQRWDGKKRLLLGDLTFPRGLLDRVKEIYSTFKIVPEEQRLASSSELETFSVSEKLVSLGKVPYPYQLDAANKIKESDCGILRMATGSGKSVVMTLMTALLGKRTIIYVIGRDLLYQLHGLFKEVFDQPIGIIGDGLCEIHDINVVSIWTAGQALGIGKKSLSAESDDEKDVKPDKYKAIRELLETAKVHIFDECHVAACTTIQEIYRHINPEHIYGMSASPWRDDGQDMMIEALLGRYIVNISASELIEQGYLVQPYIRFMKVPPFKGKEPYQTIYKNYIVDSEVRNKLVVAATMKLIEKGYQPLVLYNSLNHGQNIYDLLAKEIPCILLSGKNDNDTRARAKDDLQSGKAKAILASKIFDIGVDVPFLSGLVTAGSGKSSVRALQRIGRVIRKSEGKKSAAIIDFYDQAKYLQDHSKERYRIYCSEPKFDVKKWS